MFVCNECNSFFNEPRTEHVYINHTELDTGNCLEERVTGFCPDCGSDDIQTAAQCRCGKPCSGTNYFCDDCHEDIQHYLEYIQEEMNIGYEELKDLISEHFGW